MERGKDFGEENIIGLMMIFVRMMTIHSEKAGISICYSGLSRKFRKMTYINRDFKSKLWTWNDVL